MMLLTQWNLREESVEDSWRRVPWWGRSVALAALTLGNVLVPEKDRAFIYFQFSHRIPSGPWGRTWLLAAALCASLLAAYESTWRALGCTPSIRDDPDAWAVTVLEELAADEQFAEAVIVDALRRIIFDAGKSRKREVLYWLGSYRDAVQGPARMTESRLRALLTGRYKVTMRDDRFMQLDFQKNDAPERIKIIHRQILEQGTSEEAPEIAATICRVGHAVRRIQDRGGRGSPGALSA